MQDGNDLAAISRLLSEQRFQKDEIVPKKDSNVCSPHNH